MNELADLLLSPEERLAMGRTGGSCGRAAGALRVADQAGDLPPSAAPTCDATPARSLPGRRQDEADATGDDRSGEREERSRWRPPRRAGRRAAAGLDLRHRLPGHPSSAWLGARSSWAWSPTRARWRRYQPSRWTCCARAMRCAAGPRRSRDPHPRLRGGGPPHLGSHRANPRDLLARLARRAGWAGLFRGSRRAGERWRM